MLPVIGEEIGNRLAALLFVDAVVPAIDRPHQTPAALLPMLDAHTTDGRLAHWLDWWPEDVADLVPDPEDRDELRADMPSVPRDFYDDSIPMPESWSDGPCGYLQLSDAYADDRARAKALDWPVRVIDSTHLGIFTAPARALDAVLSLISA